MIAPSGWHIPSETEWKNLLDFLGGTALAVDRLKKTETPYWINPDTSATNDTRFSAIPGGYIEDWPGWKSGFDGLGLVAKFWSSTGDEFRVHYFDIGYIQEAAYGYNHGYSVRCIKD